MRYVCGKGLIGSGRHKTGTKLHKAWQGMLMRCYSEKYTNKYPTYKDCIVEDSWLDFQNFAEWLEPLWFEGAQIDKDLKVYGNKVYSEETCLVIPAATNLFLTDRVRFRGSCVVGVTYNNERAKYCAACKDFRSGKVCNLGRYNTEQEAFEAYALFKIALVDYLDCSEDIKRHVVEHLYVKFDLIRKDKEWKR